MEEAQRSVPKRSVKPNKAHVCTTPNDLRLSQAKDTQSLRSLEQALDMSTQVFQGRLRPASAPNRRLQSAGCIPPASGTSRRRPTKGVMDPKEAEVLAERLLAERLGVAPLEPVLTDMATPLEKEFAEELGIAGEALVPRLPADTTACSSGARCIWRWLGRMAIEEAAGTRMNQLEVCEMVARLRKDLEGAGKQRQRDAEALAKLQDSQAADASELCEFRGVRERLARANIDKQGLQELNKRLVATTKTLEQEVQIKVEQRKFFAAELAEAQAREEELAHRFEDAENKLKIALHAKETSVQQVAEDQRWLYLERKEYMRTREETAKDRILKARAKKARKAAKKARLSTMRYMQQKKAAIMASIR